MLLIDLKPTAVLITYISLITMTIKYDYLKLVSGLNIPITFYSPV